MRLKLDENIGHRVRERFLVAGHDVDTVHNEGLAGAVDEVVLAAAVAERRALVTFDVGVANPFRFDPAATTGIVVLRLPKDASRNDVDIVVTRVAEALARADVSGELWVADVHRVRAYRPDGG